MRLARVRTGGTANAVIAVRRSDEAKESTEGIVVLRMSETLHACNGRYLVGLMNTVALSSFLVFNNLVLTIAPQTGLEQSGGCILTTQIFGSRVYTGGDADPTLIKRRAVAIFGYGSQGHAQRRT